jgi:signal transduction histidine kinase
MGIPMDHDEQLLAAGGAPAALIRKKEWVVEEFVRRLRERLLGAHAPPTPIIINTLPAFVTRLALALSPTSDLEFASEYSNIALAHGNERARLTEYSLAEVIHEYQILREIFAEVLRRHASLTEAEWGIVHRSIDEAIAEAASAYVETYQRFRDLFTAALSHDFRGPLANAMNYLDLVRRDAEPGQHSHFAVRALFNLKRIDRMIQDLLDATRSTSGARLVLRIESGEARALASEVIGDLVLRAGDRFVLDAPQAIHGHWDSERLKQALNNLLENAVKYGAEDQPITCRVSSIDSRLFFSVHNHGEPIAPEIIPVLFEPFRRAAKAEKSGKAGWGLGLVLVQAIANAHGGSVGVESSRDDGTVFTIDILCDARLMQSDAEGLRGGAGHQMS